MKQMLAVLSVVALAIVVVSAQSQGPGNSTDRRVQLNNIPIVVASAQQMPTTPELKITNGPGVDHIGNNAAEVFWNTNEKAGSEVHYGTSRTMLTERAEGPGNTTDHKVWLKNLQPETTYYFQVTSSEAKSGTGIYKTHSASQDRDDKARDERK